MIRLKKIDSSNKLSDVEERDNFNKILDSKYDKFYAKDSKDSKNKLASLQKKIHKKITSDYKDLSPHVNGYYYIHMVHGTWMDDITAKKSAKDSKAIFEKGMLDKNIFSSFTNEHFNKIDESFGQIATDIDIPQINLEHDMVSGKNKNLSYVSKLNFNGDFSINFLETNINLIFRYHTAWYDYIDYYKKGYIIPSTTFDDTSEFIDVPYFNAVWVAVFAPFSTNIRCLIKIMGVSPVNLPLKQIIGDRSKSSLTTINQNYKSNDMIFKFYETEGDYAASPFFQDFLNDMGVKS